MRQLTKSVICGALLSSILLSPVLCSAQSTTLTLIEQLRALNVILSAPSGAPPEVFTKFKANPWNETPPTEAEIKAELKRIDVTLGAAQGAGSGVSFFPESAVINGITDFVVNRAKDEVSISFLIGLRDRIASDALLKILFRQTLIVANQLEASSAKQLLLPLRAAVTADIRAIPETLLTDETAIEGFKIDIEKLEKLDQSPLTPERQKKKAALEKAIKDFKASRATLKVLSQSLREVTKGVPVLTTVSSYADLTPKTFENPPEMRYALITVGTVVREYRWAPLQSKENLTDATGRDRFLALLIRDLKASQGAGEKAAVEAWSQHVQTTSVQLNEILTAVDVVVHTVENLQKSPADEKGNKSEAFADVAHAALQLIAAGRPFVKDTATWDKTAAAITHINNLQVAIISRDYISAVTESTLFLSSLDPDIKVPNSVMKPLTFGATLASAKTSEEVTAAVEAVALPPLSFRAKRSREEGERSTWVGINAYVGGSFGREHTTSTGSDKVGFGGLSIPLGVEVGTPLSNRIFSSFSVFAPLIDVGTVASFRFKETDTEQTPALTFSQVVAPGGYAVFGLTKKYPVSIGAGAQFVPKFRRDTGNNSPTDVIRYGVFIAIDVPIFRF